jgi:phosphoribosylanthranilate isomerase
MPDSMIVKVCGMREPGNIREIAALGIHWMGFIFYAQSKRNAMDANPLALRSSLADSGVKSIGVFVDMPEDDLLKKARSFDLDGVQLHGPYSPQTAERLKQEGLMVIQVFSPNTPYFSWEKLESFVPMVDYFLFDTAGFYPGGNGTPFDWSILKDYPYQKEFILSGGLGADTLNDLKHFSHPYWKGIDLNSRFEKQPGLKDGNALKVFLNQLKNDK